MLKDKNIEVSRIENGFLVEFNYREAGKDDDFNYETKKYAFTSLQDTALKVNELLAEL
jgi:hypothetical protein